MDNLSIQIYTKDFAEKKLYSVITESMDVPLNGSYDAEDVIEYFSTKLVSWVIFKELVPVAIIGIDKHSRYPDYFTTTLVFKNARGNGLNKIIKQNLAQCSVLLRIPLNCIVRDWNIRSFYATQKVFPTLNPTVVALDIATQPVHSESGYLFNFSQAPYNDSLPPWEDFYAVMTHWWASVNKSS